MTKDMTSGNPLKLILFFAIPIFIGNVFQCFYNIMDSVIVGQFLGVDALAAVGTTGSLNFMVIGWINGMTSGFGILLAQAFGAKDFKLLRHYIAMSIYLCIFLAVLMTSGLLLLNPWLLSLINTPDSIFAATSSYICVIYAGLAVTILYNMLASLCRSLGDSKTPLYFLALSSLLNIGLDVLFVAVLPFGVAGAAYATVLAQAVSAVLCFVYIRKKYKFLKLEKHDFEFSMCIIGKLISIGTPMGLQFSITAIGTMIVQSALNRLGPSYIASFAASNKIQSIVIQVFPSLGTSLATYVGQNYGAKKLDRIRIGIRQSTFLSLGYSIIAMVLAYFLCWKMVQLFTADPTGELQEIAKTQFHINLWFYAPLGLIFIYRNALQGLGFSMMAMVGGIFELVARAIGISLLAAPFGFTGICFCDPLAWISALIPLVPYYFWKMKHFGRFGDGSAVRSR